LSTLDRGIVDQEERLSTEPNCATPLPGKKKKKSLSSEVASGGQRGRSIIVRKSVRPKRRYKHVQAHNLRPGAS